MHRQVLPKHVGAEILNAKPRTEGRPPADWQASNLAVVGQLGRKEHVLDWRMVFVVRQATPILEQSPRVSDKDLGTGAKHIERFRRESSRLTNVHPAIWTFRGVHILPNGIELRGAPLWGEPGLHRASFLRKLILARRVAPIAWLGTVKVKRDGNSARFSAPYRSTRMWRNLGMPGGERAMSSYPLDWLGAIEGVEVAWSFVGPQGQ